MNRELFNEAISVAVLATEGLDPFFQSSTSPNSSP